MAPCPSLFGRTILIDELKLLLDAEWNYAYFNAQRTAVDALNAKIEKRRAYPFVIVSDSSRPSSDYYNRAIVLPSVSSLDDVLKEIPASVRALELLIPQQTEENYVSLIDAQFKPLRSLCYLSSNPVENVAREDITHSAIVRQLQPNQHEFFFDLLAQSGAKFSEAKKQATSQYYCNDSFRCLVAFDDKEQPLGWATMYVHEETAFFANAFTLPPFRGKGVHSTLLRARLDLACQLRLSRVFTDVEPASQSHRNCDRAGFRLLSVNSIWERKS